MKIKLLKYIGLLVSLVFVFSLLPQSAATVVWSDNFEDGNYDGWTVMNGDWRVRDGILETDPSGLTDDFDRIGHNSTQIIGSWRFDAWVLSNLFTQADVVFMVNDTDSPKGYGIRIHAGDLYFLKQNGPWEHSTLLVKVSIEEYEESYAHFDVTRNSTGGFHVYVNATSSPTEPKISFIDTEFDSSEKFVINCWLDNLNRFDNITVDDEIWPLPLIDRLTTTTSISSNTTPTNGGTTPPPPDMTLLITGAGVAGVVIVAAVVFTRRR